ncbi:MAG: hypothetical protein ACLQUY_01170 [Ktedonobacterales bacterium]
MSPGRLLSPRDVSKGNNTGTGMDSTGSEPEDELGPQPDELEIEVSQLPQRAHHWGDRWFWAPVQGPSDTGLAPWYQRRVEVPCALVAAALTVLVILLILVVIEAPSLGTLLGTLGTRSTPTPLAAVAVSTIVVDTPPPSPYPSPTPIAPAIGSVPTTCPPGSPLVAFDPTAIVPGVGGQGVWLVADAFLGTSGGGNLGHSATAELGSLSPSDYTLVGWPVQVMVLVQVGLTQPITLTGYDLWMTYSLWFSADANNPGAIDGAAPLATIDPSQVASSTSDGRWKIWFGVLYLPGAGCYRLHASWPGGGWTVAFASGR